MVRDVRTAYFKVCELPGRDRAGCRLGSMDYQPRLIDRQLDELLGLFPAIAIDGAKGVGKTATVTRRAGEVFTLDVEP